MTNGISVWFSILVSNSWTNDWDGFLSMVHNLFSKLRLTAREGFIFFLVADPMVVSFQAGGKARRRCRGVITGDNINLLYLRFIVGMLSMDILLARTNFHVWVCSMYYSYMN